jgi:hypothetical protein
MNEIFNELRDEARLMELNARRTLATAIAKWVADHDKDGKGYVEVELPVMHTLHGIATLHSLNGKTVNLSYPGGGGSHAYGSLDYYTLSHIAEVVSNI